METVEIYLCVTYLGVDLGGELSLECVFQKRMRELRYWLLRPLILIGIYEDFPFRQYGTMAIVVEVP